MSLPSDVQMSDAHPRRLSISSTASRRRRASTASRRSQAHSPTVPRGFIATPKVHERPLHTLSTRELWDRLEFNAKILRDTASSSQSAYVARMEVEQMQIQARLNEQGISTLNAQLGGVHLALADQAHNDIPKMIPAKRMALERFERAHTGKGSLLLPEAEAQAIQARAQQYQDAKDRRAWERRAVTGKIMPGEQLTEGQIQSRLWSFMNYKPTESDEEFEDAADSDDEEDDVGRQLDPNDPATWFDPDEEDQGHDIIPPDELDYFIQVEQPGGYGVMKIEH